MQEFEKKLMLSKEAYDHLRQNICQDARSVSQTNYYFDTDDFSMNKRGVTCRIRQKNGVYKATIRNHSVQKLDCSIEEDLAEKSYFDLNTFSSLGIHLQGDLITERIVVFADNTCEMVLDRNIYLGTVDDELEIEYLLGFEEKATGLLNEIIDKLLHQGFDVSREEIRNKSKSERFFARKSLQSSINHQK